MGIKKIRYDCKILAKCGLTSHSRCRANTAYLKECETCTLVNKASKRWKMIDRKPYKKCKNCGEFKSVESFYPRRIRKPNGVVYETTEPVCKVCRSVMRIRKIKEDMKKNGKTNVCDI